MSINLDVTKFLSLPLNTGVKFVDFDGVCGCIKGNFYRSIPDIFSWPEHREAVECKNQIYYENKCVISGEDKRISPFAGSIFGLAYDRPGNIHKTRPELARILDRAEAILIYQRRPQFAKLFLIRALRRFGFIPQETRNEKTIAVPVCSTSVGLSGGC